MAAVTPAEWQAVLRWVHEHYARRLWGHVWHDLTSNPNGVRVLIDRGVIPVPHEAATAGVPGLTGPLGPPPAPAPPAPARKPSAAARRAEEAKRQEAKRRAAQAAREKAARERAAAKRRHPATPAQVAARHAAGHHIPADWSRWDPADYVTWAIDVLTAWATPTPTVTQIGALIGWSHYREGGGGAWNPLNTTLPEPGATTFNSAGVRNYTGFRQGVLATAATLAGYPAVRQMFRAETFGQRPGGELLTWSGGGYATIGQANVAGGVRIAREGLAALGIHERPGGILQGPPLPAATPTTVNPVPGLTGPLGPQPAPGHTAAQHQAAVNRAWRAFMTRFWTATRQAASALDTAAARLDRVR